VAPIFARWAVVPLIVFFRSARPTGLGQPFRAHAHAAHVAAASVLPVALSAWAGGATPAAGAAALGVALALGAWLNRRLDGLTGDVYGAAIELAELAVLITLR
jgi:adenosylcobinamide-GDP ribazoletransferase